MNSTKKLSTLLVGALFLAGTLALPADAQQGPPAGSGTQAGQGAGNGNGPGDGTAPAPAPKDGTGYGKTSGKGSGSGTCDGTGAGPRGGSGSKGGSSGSGQRRSGSARGGRADRPDVTNPPQRTRSGPERIGTAPRQSDRALSIRTRNERNQQSARRKP